MDPNPLITFQALPPGPHEFQVVQAADPQALATLLTKASHEGYRLLSAQSWLTTYIPVGTVLTIAILARPLPTSEPEKPREARSGPTLYGDTRDAPNAVPGASQGLD